MNKTIKMVKVVSLILFAIHKTYSCSSYGTKKPVRIQNPDRFNKYDYCGTAN